MICIYSLAGAGTAMQLLTQMEAFGGIFVCATNFLQYLDRAALRRFRLKIGFGYLTAEQSFELLKAMTNRTDDRKPDDDALAPIRERLSRIGNSHLAISRWFGNRPKCSAEQ